MSRLPPGLSVCAVAGRHGVPAVKIMDVRDPDRLRTLVLAPEEWRLLLPLIDAACRIAERPGRCPGEPDGPQ